MKNKIPSEGLRLGRDSGSILCDTLKKWRFRTSWGGCQQTLPCVFFPLFPAVSYVYLES